VRGTEAEPAPHLYSLVDVLALDIPAPRYLVPGLLSEGMNLLAGKPKLGKSLLALNLSLTIAAGGQALGVSPAHAGQVEPGHVLYLSLEDRLRRLQFRARRILGGLNVEASARLVLATMWPRQDRGGLTHIAAWLDSVGRPALVVIDIWARFRATVRQGCPQYDQDYAHAAEVKELLDARAASALILHHCKKAAAEDVLDEISGTLGLAGCADGAVILSRTRGENRAKLFITGRDVDDRELELAFDPAVFTWTAEGDGTKPLGGELQLRIMAYLRLMGPRGAYTAQIAAYLKEPEQRKVRTVLYRLQERRLIIQRGNTWLCPPDDEPTGAEPEEPIPD
jgi:hypothetical protein